MAEKKKNPLELLLFTDEPVRDLEHDHLALRPFSSMVAAAALTNRGPFNIGVFSGWGQGKTTVLRQAQALIAEQEKPNVITAWVNAWQYEHEAHPIVPLLAIIINEITKAIDARKCVSKKEDAALAKTFGDLKRALRAIAYGFSAKAGASIPGFANLEIGFVAKDMIDRDEKLSSDRDPLLDQSLYYHAYERLESFREQLAKVSPADQPKIIVFIDDLDRCLPSKALHLLESLKLVLAQPGFIFVLGVDRHVIDSFLTKRYHREFGIPRDKGHGKQYMDKIIQLPLDLPHHQNRFEKYIGNLISGTPSLPAAFTELFTNKADGPAFIAALAAGCDRTPRTLIRTLNYLLTDLFLRENEYFIAEKDPFPSSAEFLQFAAVSRITRITFGSERERLYRQMVEFDNVCDQLSGYLSKQDNIWSISADDPASGYHYPEGAEYLDERRAFYEQFRSAILGSDSLDELFRTEVGLQWLKFHKKRQAIEGYLSTREDSGQPADENSEQIINTAIRKNLGLRDDQGIGDEDRKKITELDLSGTHVTDLKVLESLTNLQVIYLRDTQVIDITPLQNLTCLTKLYLGGSGISELSLAIGLGNLQVLGLTNTQVSNITPLKGLTNLQRLYLGGTHVSDITPIYVLNASLKKLDMKNTPAARDKVRMAALRKAMPHTEIIA